jgi:hypothetical protein
LAIAGALVGLVFTSGAQAAYVRIVPRVIDAGGDYATHYDVVYDGEGLEANSVVVAAHTSAVEFSDPGVFMHTDPFPTTIYFDEDGYPISNYGCATPGVGVATCVATPGTYCAGMYCGAPDAGDFRGLLKVAGNAGNDRIVVDSSNLRGAVWGVGGDDVIETRDGTVENVSCGTGTDRVIADAKDIVEANCESVTRR